VDERRPLVRGGGAHDPIRSPTAWAAGMPSPAGGRVYPILMQRHRMPFTAQFERIQTRVDDVAGIICQVLSDGWGWGSPSPERAALQAVANWATPGGGGGGASMPLVVQVAETAAKVVAIAAAVDSIRAEVGIEGRCRFSPRHPSHSAPVLATSSTTL